MIVDPSIAQPEALPTPGVRSANDIVDHLKNLMAAQPPEVQDAVDHAHAIMGLQSPTQMEQAGNGAMTGASPLIPGLRQIGNTDLGNRPVLKNPDGSISTMSTASFGTDKGETLLPTVVNGKRLSNSEALDEYRRTGNHMGVFDTPENADKYAQSMHDTIAGQMSPGGASGNPSAIVAAPSAGDAQPIPTPKTVTPSPVVSDPASGMPLMPPTSPSATAPASPATAPNVHMQNLERMTAEGPGVNKIHNPFLRGLAHVGDALGSGLFPEFTSYVPGFTAHHQQLLNQEEGQLAQEQKQEKHASDLAQEAATTKLTEAQVPHVQAETAALGNPKDEFALFHQQNPTGTVTDFVKQQESGKNPTSPYQIWHKEPANADKGYMEFLKEEAATKPPANELELYVKTHPDEVNPLAGYEHEKQNITSKPLTKETADALNANYNTLAKQYKGIPADQFHEGMTSAEATQIKAAMLGAIAGTQKGQSITINQGKADNAAATKRDAETSKEFVRVNKRLTTGYDKLQGQMDNLDAAEKEISGTAPAQALGIIKSIVATAGGQGSGVRITQAELNSLTKARNLGDSFEAWLQKFGSGKSLAPEQVSQIREMLGGIREAANAKHQQYLDSLDRLNGARSVQDVRQIESDFNHAQSGSPAPAAGTVKDGYKFKGGNPAEQSNWEKVTP